MFMAKVVFISVLKDVNISGEPRIVLPVTLDVSDCALSRGKIGLEIVLLCCQNRVNLSQIRAGSARVKCRVKFSNQLRLTVA